MKINKEKLYEQLETMNKEQLIELCKSTTSIIDDLQNKIDKANNKLEKLQKNLMEILNLGIPIKDITDIQDILRGKDNGNVN